MSMYGCGTPAIKCLTRRTWLLNHGWMDGYVMGIEDDKREMDAILSTALYWGLLSQLERAS